MKVTVEVREEVFRTPKTPQQIEDDVRQGATMLWLARGDITPDRAREVTMPAPLPAEPATPPREPMLYDLLILGPDVGEDADFEQPRKPARTAPMLEGDAPSNTRP
jgi:hypothetical protein